MDARSHDTLQSKTYHHGISHANLIQESHKDASSLTSTHMSTYFKIIQKISTKEHFIYEIFMIKPNRVGVM